MIELPALRRPSEPVRYPFNRSGSIADAHTPFEAKTYRRGDIRRRHVHLVGAGGAGMSSLAAWLVAAGHEVSGSDAATTGHNADHVGCHVDWIVHSDAIADDNCELAQARRLQLPTLSYAQALGRITAAHHTLAVAGTHGKSTTSAMTTEILQAAGLAPSAIVGARPIGAASGGRLGAGELLVAEACEFNRNFLHLQPTSAAVLNVEHDHFDCYPHLAMVERAFVSFVERLPREGALVLNGDCPRAVRLARSTRAAVETFGADSRWRARSLCERNGRYRFALIREGRFACYITLQIPGRHNVNNALAAAALADSAGAGTKAIAEGLERFAGLHRRLETLGSPAGVTLVDDYAHHPTEIAASLTALRAMFPQRRRWVIFQPHQGLRTARLLDGLAASLHNGLAGQVTPAVASLGDSGAESDRLLIADVYRAREEEAGDRANQATATDLARRLSALGCDVPGAHAVEDIERILMEAVEPGDVVLTMGAGDIGKLAHGIGKRLRKNCAAR